MQAPQACGFFFQMWGKCGVEQVDADIDIDIEENTGVAAGLSLSLSQAMQWPSPVF